MSRVPEATPPSTARSPRGEEFDVVGRARPLHLRAAPALLAESREDLLVIKEGALFMCSRPNGDIFPGLVSGEGLYTHDTRFLSEFRMTLGGKRPVLLSSSAELAYAMVIDATNPNLGNGKGVKVPQQTLSVRRFRFLSERLYERVTVRNFALDKISTQLQLSMAADFADTFEVRGFSRRKARGHALAPKAVKGGVRFAYIGEDNLFRETLVEFNPEPTELELLDGLAVARWDVELPQFERMSVLVKVEPSIEGKRRRSRSIERAEDHVRAQHDRWKASGAAIQTDNEHFNAFINGSIRDLKALMTPMNGGEIFAAGIPWYVAPFGRDSLLTCYESLLWNPATAAATLRLLAKLQSSKDDPWRDAEPGKMPHELRVGELARAGIIPHTPYYGTVDATPLFVMLAAAYYRWTGDLETMRSLQRPLDLALQWIARYGDLDGDGFLEYHRRSPAGLDNQGWKDSGDCIVHLDGSLAEGPIALCEVQGYVFLAKMRIADVYEDLGEHDIAESLRREAAELRAAFDEAFWMPDEGTYALALDGQKRQVRSITSNPGHCLYCGIVPATKGRLVTERLMAADMFSGWGIRTLSSESRAYNPMGYHTGSVWPHDNVIIAAGMKRYGMSDATDMVATALFDAARSSRGMRLDELYCGFQRREGLPPVAYPVACSPQAWAAAVPLMMVQAFLGISPRAHEGLLTINQPRLPSWLKRMELSNVTAGDSKVSMAFTREGLETGFSMTGRRGDVRVMIEQ
ncbi:MAG: amylo-alpha-1,6-glucosidase [Actinomycetota bacterium]|nr:amylo-alpha-1,6-glucosidase [Actinomycetota bacterium]